MNEQVAPLRLKREKVVAAPPALASNLPIASILVDTGLLHLDQELDFLVPQELSEHLTPGTLVKVPFNRKRVLGVVLSRKSTSAYAGRLRFVSEQIRSLPLVTPTILTLIAEVSQHYGGNRWDTLRYALPNFSSKSKKFESSTELANKPARAVLPESEDHRYSEYFWRALQERPSAQNQIRAFWAAPPAENPLLFLEKLVESTVRSVLLVMPDYVDVQRMFELLTSTNKHSGKKVVTWHSQLTRSERENTFLQILQSEEIIVLGVRGSLFLPIKNLDLIMVWEESNESHSEPRSPYFHGREVAIMRANIENTHLILAGFSPSMRSASYIEKRYLIPLTFKSGHGAQSNISVEAINNRNSPVENGRISSRAWRTIKSGLENGPVLIQVPVRGYVQSLSCSTCRNRALCSCGGKLVLTHDAGTPTCTLCHDLKRSWNCSYCHSQQLRQSQIGDLRIAEELGRAFPNQRVVFSNRDHRIPSVPDEPMIVVTTPGAEPVAQNGYGAIVVLNSQLLLDRATLDSEVETRNRWFYLGCMLKQEGIIYVDCDYANRNIQALVRWDPIGIALTELGERRNLLLPPTVKAVEVSGDLSAVTEVVRNLPENVLVSHPLIAHTGESVVLIRAKARESQALISEIFRRTKHQSASGARVARVKIDPVSL